MAGPRTCHSPRCNPLPSSKDKFAGGPPGAPTKGSNTPTPSPPVSRAQTPADAPAPTPAPPSGTYTDVDLQRATKLALESFVQGQAHAQGSEPREKPLKARFPDLYWGNSHQDCYRFCQQCEDHFETAGAKGSNRISFAASFLRGSVVQRWLQHKRQHDGAAPMTWAEFKAFLRKNLGDSRVFVDGIWSKLKRDSQYQLEEVQDWTAHLKYL